MASVIGGNDSTCVLLLHGDGDNDAHVIVNKAAGGLTKTITLVEQVRTTTADKKFGHGSILFDGGGAYLKIAASPDFGFSRSDFTIDFWLSLDDLLRAYPFAWWLDDDNFFALERVHTGAPRVQYQVRLRDKGVDLLTAIMVGGAVTMTGWVHFAVTRKGASLRLFIGGTERAEAAQLGVDTPADLHPFNLQTWPLYIGASRWVAAPAGGLLSMEGRIDEFRILKGVAAWSASSFTPYDNAYTPRFTARDRGIHDVRAAYSLRDRGRHGVARHPFVVNDRGAHHVIESFVQNDRGIHRIRQAFVQNDKGVHGIARAKFALNDRGGHQIRQVYTVNDRGGHGIASGSFVQNDRGGHIIRAGFLLHDKGVHTVRLNFAQHDSGRHRIDDETIELYEVFYLLGGEPDLTAAPWQTFAALPYTTPAITGAGLHYFVLRKRDRWNQTSENVQSTIIELDGSDNKITRAPSDGTVLAVAAAKAAAVLVTGLYYYDRDPGRSADQWLIYITNDGSNPDPAIDAPVVISMSKADGIAQLNWTSPTYSGGDTVKVIVRTRRLSPLRDSVNATIITTTAATTAPGTPSLDQLQQFGGGLLAPPP